MLVRSGVPHLSGSLPEVTTHFSGSSSKRFFEADKAALQEQLLRLQPEKEGISHFNLAPEEQVPKCVRRQYDKAIENLSSQKLASFIDRNLLGVGEESADLLCYIGMKASLQSGALTNDQLNGFANRIAVQLKRNPGLSFNEIESWGRQEVKRTQGVDKFVQFLPTALKSAEPKLRQSVEDFLSMLLADKAVRNYAQQTGGEFTGGYIQEKLEEELEEIRENVFNPNYTVKDRVAGSFARLAEAASVDLASEESYHTAWNRLVDFANESTDQKTVTLTNLFDYNNLKSNGRVEVFLRNENHEYGDIKLTYKECKQISKPYEKLLEAALLLKRA